MFGLLGCAERAFIKAAVTLRQVGRLLASERGTAVRSPAALEVV